MRLPIFRRLAALVLLCIALSGLIVAKAQPYGVTIRQHPVYKGEAVDFRLDLSDSQRAEDVGIRPVYDQLGRVVNQVPVSRLEATKIEIDAAVEKMKAKGVSYFCLSYFTLRPNRLLECSDDINGFREVLKHVDTSFAQGTGTNLLAAFENDYKFLRSSVPPDTRITAVVVTDGGREVCRHTNGSLEVVDADWTDEQLRDQVKTLTTEEHIRIIPVGVGGQVLAPVPVLDRTGRKTYITCPDGDSRMTRLDQDAIKNIATWSGDSSRYFILDESTQKDHKLAEWLTSYMTAELVVDHYVPEAEISGNLWRYADAVFIVAGALALGAFGCFGRMAAWLFKRKSL